MPYITDERLKSYLDTNQLHREQLCLAILATDKRFSNVRPRHPHGGPDGGRDIEAHYTGDLLAYGAIGFINQANDSSEQKRKITTKFKSDLKSALSTEASPKVFVFFSNINFTVLEKLNMIETAKKQGIALCEIFDRERMRISLDSTDGFSIRFQYLNIPLSEAEQASFFARWGDEIQSVITTRFDRIENTLNRLLFLQEACNPLESFTMTVQLDREYAAAEIGHFRLFALIQLIEPKHNIIDLVWGKSDRSERTSKDSSLESISRQRQGIKHGISGVQWLRFLTEFETDDEEDKTKRYKRTSSLSSVGLDTVEFLQITYLTGDFIRFGPSLLLKDFEDARFVLFANDTLATKVKRLHVFSNGYKLKEYSENQIEVDKTDFQPSFPVLFLDDELADKWTRIRPKGSSTFSLTFYEETPMRIIEAPMINSTTPVKGRAIDD